MKNLWLFSIIGFLSTSCVSKKDLYFWDKYDVSSYLYLKNNNEQSAQELIATYESIIVKQNEIRKVVPPGIYADYGFILMQNGKVEKGNLMLQKEIELYPESKIFIDRIIKMQEK
ncbi:MAG: DUF4810 domain-containing protein [Bacteroidetes bacterium]|nr:DUF4810 domain-containing protein [Bacteroidota bacterium]